MRTSARPGGSEVERCAPLDLSPLRPRPPPALPAGAMAGDAAHTGAGPIDQQMTQLIQDLRTAADGEQKTAFLEAYYFATADPMQPTQLADEVKAAFDGDKGAAVVLCVQAFKAFTLATHSSAARPATITPPTATASPAAGAGMQPAGLRGMPPPQAPGRGAGAHLAADQRRSAVEAEAVQRRRPYMPPQPQAARTTPSAAATAPHPRPLPRPLAE